MTNLNKVIQLLEEEANNKKRHITKELEKLEHSLDKNEIVDNCGTETEYLTAYFGLELLGRFNDAYQGEGYSTANMYKVYTSSSDNISFKEHGVWSKLLSKKKAEDFIKLHKEAKKLDGEWVWANGNTKVCLANEDGYIREGFGGM